MMKRWSVDARLVVVFVVLALWAGRILSWRGGYEEGYVAGWNESSDNSREFFARQLLPMANDGRSWGDFSAMWDSVRAHAGDWTVIDTQRAYTDTTTDKVYYGPGYIHARPTDQPPKPPRTRQR